MTSRRSFTLVEVVLAVGLTAALLTAALTMVVRVTGFWDGTAGRLQVESQARLILDLLEEDLTSVVWRRDGGVWLAATIQDDPATELGHAVMADETWAVAVGGVGKPGAAGGSLRLEDELSRCRFGSAGVWLRLFTRGRPARGESTAPRAVAYQIVRRRPGGVGAPQYQLFRSVVPPEVCFATGYDLAATRPDAAGDDAPGAPGAVRRPPVDALLGHDVLDFGLRLYADGPGGARQRLFPDDPPYEYQFDRWGRLPTRAEVFVRLARPEGARRLRRLEQGEVRGSAGDWWREAEAHSLVFSRWIRLPAEAL